MHINKSPNYKKKLMYGIHHITSQETYENLIFEQPDATLESKLIKTKLKPTIKRI